MCEKRGIFDYGLGGSLFKPALESWFKWDFRCFLHFPRFLFLKNVVLAQGCSVILLLWLGLHSCWALMQHLYDISEYFHLGFNIKMCKWCRESLTSLVDPNNSANRTVKHVSCVWSTCWVRARYKFAKSLEMNWKAWEIGTTSVWRVGGGGGVGDALKVVPCLIWRKAYIVHLQSTSFKVIFAVQRSWFRNSNNT